MGTLIELRLVCPDTATCERGFSGAADTLGLIDRQMSLYHESELTRINAAAGSLDPMQAVSIDTERVIATALLVASRSEGYFDPTIAPLLDLFRFYEVESGSQVAEPGPDKIADALDLVNFRNLRLVGHRAGLMRRGMKMDLGGIAKGYALDIIAQRFRMLGLRRFSLNFGGHLLAAGISHETTVRHPLTGRPWLACRISRGSLSVSAQNERFVRTGTKRIGHIFHSMSGAPIEPNQIIAVYHESAMLADAWSTALFFADERKFLSWARQNQLIAYRLSALNMVGRSAAAETADVCKLLAG